MQNTYTFFTDARRRAQRWAGIAALLLAGAQAAQAQQAKNGNYTVTTTASTTIVNEYTALTADAAAGANTLTVASNNLNANARPAFGNAALAPGDLVLIIQMQGATIDASDAASYGSLTAYNSAGRNELAEVQAVTGTTGITLACNLKYSYSAAGRAQVVRVPRFSTLAVNASATLTGVAWNGTTGGVVAAEVQNGITVNGTVSATGLGFRGGATDNQSADAGTFVSGYRGPDPTFGGEKGESIVGYQADYDNLNGRYGRGAPANGGGGGNSHNAGGGGGANAGTGTWTGTGNPDRGTNNAYDPAWNLEGTNFATSTSPGGGRGGYSYSNNDRDALTVAPGNVAWGGNSRQNVGGFGGRPLDQRGRLYLGGGGGAGDGNNNGATAGGNGGGLVYLQAGGALGGSGSIVANGTTGVRIGTTATLTSTAQDAPGGGGGGGSISLTVSGTITGVAVAAQGGTGGSQAGGATEAQGPGGGGGGGVVAYTSNANNTSTFGVAPGVNGTTTAGQVSEFPPNGATRGGAGITRTMLVNGQCAVADVTTTLAPTANPVAAGQSGGFTVTFSNTSTTTGANEIAAQVQLPTGLSNVTASNGGTYDPTTGLVTYAGLTSLGASQQATSTISFTTPGTGPVNATSSISTTTGQGANTNPDTASSSFNVTPVADVTTSISGPTALGSGQPSGNYTVTYTNNGPSPAANVTQVVKLPAGATNVVAQGSQSITTNNDGTVTIVYVPADPLASGASVSHVFSFTAPTVTGQNNPVTIVSTTSTTTSEGANNAPDQYTLNANITDQTADVLTNTSAQATPVAAGATGQFNITFKNAGPNTAPNAVRQVQLPAGLSNVTASNGGTYNASTGLVTYPALPSSFTNGTTLTSTITFTAPADGTTSITATSNISSDAYDNNSGNNSTSASITITPTADVVTAISGPSTATAGSSVTYTATYTNNGPSTAANVVPTIQLPKGLLNYVIPTGASYNVNTGIVTLPTISSLASGASQTSTISFTLPNNDQTVTGKAADTADTSDPNAANNNGTQAAAIVTTTVTLPAGNCAGTTPGGNSSTQGLYAEYYAGYFADDLTFFTSKTPGLTRSETTINYGTTGWGDITAVIANTSTASNPDYYSTRYRGYITITTAGSYTFTLTSDDASYLWIGPDATSSPLDKTKATVNDGGAHGAQAVTSAALNLAPGRYAVQLLYGEQAGQNVLNFQYNGPDTNGSTITVPGSVLCSGTAGVPLPVVLAEFTAVAHQAAANLAWATASELRSAYFGIERSLDGQAFTEVGRVAAQGNRASTTRYAFADAQAGLLGAPQVYYRLRQVDQDGSFSYSPVRTVAFGAASATQLQLYPNPATSQLHVALGAPAAAGATLTVYTLLGQPVLTGQLGANGQADLGLADLPTGTYLLRLLLPDGTSQRATFSKQ